MNRKLIFLIIFLFSLGNFLYGQKSLSYSELEKNSDKELIERAVKTIKNRFPYFRREILPEILIRKNSKTFEVIFFSGRVFASNHLDEIYSISVDLISENVSYLLITEQRGAEPGWPFFDSDREYEYKIIVPFYEPGWREKKKINKITGEISKRTANTYSGSTVFIYENLTQYGIVVTDGFWTGFTLKNKITGTEKEMGYFDIITSPPEDPWEIIFYGESLH